MPTPTTREGYEKMRAELDRLESETPKIRQLIAEARAEGDLRENAEYHGQRENLAMIEAKIRQIKDRMANTIIVEKDNQPKDEVAFGSLVTVFNHTFDEEEQYELVGPGEEDYMSEPIKILSTAPLAQQLLGHRVGEKVEVEAPSGQMELEIQAIE